jgi:hypothetical protein
MAATKFRHTQSIWGHFTIYHVTTADYPGRINLNMPGRALTRDWLHCDSLDYHAQTWFVDFSFAAPLAFDRPLS